MELRCVNCKEVLKFTAIEDGFGYLVNECGECTIQQHPFVQRFAVILESQFQANEGDKRGWDAMTNQKCFVRIHEELKELLDACVNQLDPAVVMREAADVGLFLCFLAENYKRRDGK